MTFRHNLAGVVILLSMILSISPTAAQQEQEMSPEQKAMMEAWAKASTPNENHQRLTQFAGNWNFTSRWWTAPGAEPQESQGTSTCELILGGRYLRETVSSQMMEDVFEGIGFMGYDNLKKTYVSTWVDNMGTGIMVSEGSWDAGANTLTWVGEYVDAMSGKTQKMRMVTRMIGPDQHVTDFFQPGKDGKEYRSMEISYKRK